MDVFVSSQKRKLCTASSKKTIDVGGNVVSCGGACFFSGTGLHLTGFFFCFDAHDVFWVYFTMAGVVMAMILDIL